MSKDEGSGLTKSLKQGTDNSAKFPDASTKLPTSPSVNSDPVRKGVAKSSSITKGRTA